jgi:transposase
MDTIVMKACGLDVHQAAVVACIQRQGFEKVIQTFGTTTNELLSLKQLLLDQQVTHIAMESTGVYWRPVFNILDDDRWQLLLVNARHIKNVPGRKTDVQDCEWICKLLRAGLLCGSFIPAEDIRHLRSYTRYQKTLQHNIQNEKNRVHKLLQECNIKLTQVLSDIFGLTGTSILDDLAKGITDPVRLAKHMDKNQRLVPKKAQAIACLEGKFTRHHQIMLKSMLDTLRFYQQQIDALDVEVARLLSSYQMEHELLQTMPGIKEKAANHILAELSADMSAFGDEKKLSSWAGLCSGNNESAGKKKAQD